MIDVVLVWLLLFGVWPLADPGHDLSTFGSVVDVAVHFAAGFGLGLRWTIERRVWPLHRNREDDTP